MTFVKNNIVLYKNSNYSIDSCYRKSKALMCWPLTISEMNPNEIGFNFSNNVLSISKGNSTIKYEVFTAFGQKMLDDIVLIGNYRRDFSEFPKGIYMIKVQTEEQRIVKKVLVQ